MIDVVTIGGSAGSLQVLTDIISNIPGDYDYTVIIILHRLKNVYSDMFRVLARGREDLRIVEPEDKEPIKRNTIYLAPQNYHLLIEQDKTFSLDYSETVHHSRPSIDVTFESVAAIYGKKAVGILLSGASKDGALGLSQIVQKGGIGIAQDPGTAEYPIMPQSAMDINDKIIGQTPEQLVRYIAKTKH